MIIFAVSTNSSSIRDVPASHPSGDAAAVLLRALLASVRKPSCSMKTWSRIGGEVVVAYE